MENLAYFDPLLFKYPKGAVSLGTVVDFKIEVNLDCVCNEAYLMVREDAESDYKYVPMKRIDNYFYVSLNFEKEGHYFYNFKLNYNDFAKYLSRTYDTYSEVLDYKGEDFLQLVTKKEYVCKNSMQGGLIYQIFVDRFCKVGEVKAREPLIFRSDWGGKIKKNTKDPLIINLEVFGGNFEGVISKLDYLKELGVTTIYFNPICMANSNHKYDTADYMQTDSMFGNDEIFKRLLDECKTREIQVIIDGVFNHTGSDSLYFNKYKRFPTLGAYNSSESKFYNWYSFEEYPDKYKSWWGIDTLPKIRWNCTDYQDFIAGSGGVIEKYLKMGVSGFRLDVVDELTDEFVTKISNKIAEFGGSAPVIGEIWEDASTKISYSIRRKYFVNNEINSVMNYPVKESIIEFLRTKDAFSLNSTLRMLQNNYPKVVLDNLMNFLTTHDTNRIVSELSLISEGNTELTKKLLKIATGLIFTLPGVPSIFYGDEYGMENNDGSSRGCFDWNNNKNEIYDWYKKLSSIRKLNVFKDGDIKILISKDGKFVFERLSGGEHIVVLTNLKSSPLTVNFESKYISLISNKELESFELGENEIEILYEKK